jgi:hypothetical protein
VLNCNTTKKTVSTAATLSEHLQEFYDLWDWWETQRLAGARNLRLCGPIATIVRRFALSGILRGWYMSRKTISKLSPEQ